MFVRAGLIRLSPTSLLNRSKPLQARQAKALLIRSCVTFEMNRVHYSLPADKIALAPTETRGHSKLLVVGSCNGNLNIRDSSFEAITTHIPPNAHLVLNNSRVIEARLYGQLQDAAEPVEVMMLQPDTWAPGVAMSAPWVGQRWKCMIRSVVTAGSSMSLQNNVRLTVTDVLSLWDEEGEERGVEATVQFEEESSHGHPIRTSSTMVELLAQIGSVPIPPYLNRQSVAQDAIDYQTVYASEEAVGSVAAPTAGLHFTTQKLEELRVGGVTLGAVSLHVSAGTFKPVEVECIGEHQMHWESFEASVAELRGISHSITSGRPLIAVGTTSVRLTESLYWLGARMLLPNGTRGVIQLELEQWGPASIRRAFEELGDQLPSVRESFEALEEHAAGGEKVVGSTSMCCTPGYEFMVCRDGLLTNFHQPDSTLMLLVAGYLSRDVDVGVAAVQEMYEHAIDNEYRFLSYGDACLITPK